MSQPTATAAYRRCPARPVDEAHRGDQFNRVNEANPVARARTRRFEQLGR